MKVDELLAALAVMRQRLMQVDTAYSADGVQRRLNTISSMRSYVITADAQCFTDYCQRMLASTAGDLISDILDELWEELGLGCEVATWDDFEGQFLNTKEAA